MTTTVEKTYAKDWSYAGELEKETELVQRESVTEDITRQTQVLTIFCC